MASATAAGSAYSTHGEPMIPFYIFYSMFGFQRTGDSIWAMADQLARGFLIGATAGRTTLTGEGLQHADGHSPLLAATNPAVVHYDPAFAYEIATSCRTACGGCTARATSTRTARTSSTTSPSTTSRSCSPRSRTDLDVEGLLRGIYHVAGRAERSRRRRARGSSCSPRGVGCPVDPSRPQQLLAEDWGVARRRLVGDLVERARPRRASRPRSGTCSTPPRSRARRTSPTKLDGRRRARWSRSATTCARCRTRSRSGCRSDYHALGADGFGFADTRPAARRFFQVDAESVVVAGARRRWPSAGEVEPRARSQRRSTTYRIDDPTAVAGVKQEGGDA